jgi:hypothetical protein
MIQAVTVLAQTNMEILRGSEASQVSPWVRQQQSHQEKEAETQVSGVEMTGGAEALRLEVGKIEEKICLIRRCSAAAKTDYDKVPI